MKQKSIAAPPGLSVLLLIALICAGCLYDIVELPDPHLLVEPYINVQPESRALYVGDAPPVELSVTIDGWTPQDGRLSFQWYTFGSYIEYLTAIKNKTEASLAIAGENTDALDLSLLSPPLKTGAGDKNYFYVKVTNSNPEATNKQTSTVTSEVAVISFSAAGAPAIPIITQQPASTQARFGRPVNPLSVRAAFEAGAPPESIGDLYYQWYSVDLDEYGNIVDENTLDSDPPNGIPDGIPDATAIPGETGAVFSPAASRLNDSYFFVKVDNAIGRVAAIPEVPAVMGPNPDDPDGPEIEVTPAVPAVPAVPGVSTSEYSIPAIVNILPGLRASEPVISVQPRPALYFGSDSVDPLTVEAVSPDFGALSFYWYSKTRADSSGISALVATQAPDDAELLEDGVTRRASFTPPGDGSVFYYVVVSNYQPVVVGATRATATSRAVNVRRQTAAAPASGNAVVTFPGIDQLAKYNYVRGYGGMEVAWANFPETFPADTELQYDPDRLGYNILRIMLPVSNVNIDIAMDDLVNVTRRRPHYYDNVKIVNKYNGYVLASPWSPPKEWKSNNSITGGGFLRHEYYKQYAAYLKAYAVHMNNRGAPIYALSIQNEQNYAAGYDGCEWEPEEMRDFFIAHGKFTEGVRGWGGGKQIPRVLTVNGESANNVDTNHAAIDRAAAYANIDMFARHVYGERRTNLWASRPVVRRTAPDDKGKDVWMTEHNINGANAAGYYNDSKWDYIWKFMNDIDLVMRLNNENAFVWWASKRFYSMVGDGQYGTPDGQALPRGWALSHYAKYTIDTTRIGFTLTGTTANGTAVAGAVNLSGVKGSGDSLGEDMDNCSARITAFISQDEKELSLVMWTPLSPTTGQAALDMGTIEINMPNGFLINGVMGIQSYKVSETLNSYHEPYNVPVSADRRKAFVTLPANRIVSVKFTKLEE